MMRAKIGLLLGCLACGCVGLRAEVYEAPSMEPTPEETLILEFMNRFRADPPADGKRMMPSDGKKVGWIQVDWNMFQSEMNQLKPSPPLVFNLELLKAARRHSFYMIHNGLGHGETPGLRGFTGASFGERCRAAGYNGGAGGENAYASAPGPWGSHIGFVIDAGEGGTGGMQPGRGHRVNMLSAGFKEVGPGAVERPGRGSGTALSVTHNFGSSGVRYVGGVVYVDKNNNNFYDIGEGRGGVTITASDGSSAMTWKSGAYTLRLNSKSAITVKAEISGQSVSKSIPAGGVNEKFDWIIPQETELKVADQLLAKVDEISDRKLENKNYMNALIALHLGTRTLGLDEGRRMKIDGLTKEIKPDLEASMSAILDALRAFDAIQWQKLLNEKRKPYKGTTMDKWFSEADMVAKAKSSADNFKTQIASRKVPERDKKLFLQYLESSQKTLKDAQFQSEMNDLVAQAKSLISPQSTR